MFWKRQQHIQPKREGPLADSYPPQIMLSILEASRRFDPGLQDELESELNLSMQSVKKLAEQNTMLAPAQLRQLIEILRIKPWYADLMYLAGRNALHLIAGSRRAALPDRGGGAKRFMQQFAQHMPAVLGGSTAKSEMRGKLVLVEMTHSIFARDCSHELPQCQFYSGYFAELANYCSPKTCHAKELTCAVQEDAIHVCIFEVAF